MLSMVDYFLKCCFNPTPIYFWEEIGVYEIEYIKYTPTDDISLPRIMKKTFPLSKYKTRNSAKFNAIKFIRNVKQLKYGRIVSNFSK